FFFFFSSRRRHTRFSRDWSSDVCSSDLIDQNFWQSPSDLALYANQFYLDLRESNGYIWPLERFTDNQGYIIRDAYLWGESTVPTSGGGWGKADWLKIRRVNYALVRIAEMEKTPEILRYEAEIRFF